MRRDVDVGPSELDGDWSLVDPKVVPAFPGLFGKAFEDAYIDAEDRGEALDPLLVDVLHVEVAEGARQVKV